MGRSSDESRVTVGFVVEGTGEERVFVHGEGESFDEERELSESIVACAFLNPRG